MLCVVLHTPPENFHGGRGASGRACRAARARREARGMLDSESAVWPRHASERTAAVRGRSWAHRDERRDAWVHMAGCGGEGEPAAEDRVALMTTKRARVREQQVA